MNDEFTFFEKLLVACVWFGSVAISFFAVASLFMGNLTFF